MGQKNYRKKTPTYSRREFNTGRGWVVILGLSCGGILFYILVPAELQDWLRQQCFLYLGGELSSVVKPLSSTSEKKIPYQLDSVTPLN